jgi:hypothetical protein
MIGMNTVADTIAEDRVREIAAQIAVGLAKADLVQGRAFIRTPILLPSGSSVVVVVEDRGNGEYRLSDIRQGFEEADRNGMGRTYQRQAKEVAELAGIGFADDAFVLPNASPRQLIGGTITLANAVARAAERTLLRAAQRSQETAVTRLAERLGVLFPSAKVVRDSRLRGASEHEWDIDAVVTVGQRRTVFDIVTRHPTSVAFASTKFHDLALLDPAPVRVAVVHRKASFGNLLGVVAQAARVVEDDAPDSAFMRAAEHLAA